MAGTRAIPITIATPTCTNAMTMRPGARLGKRWLIHRAIAPAPRANATRNWVTVIELERLSDGATKTYTTRRSRSFNRPSGRGARRGGTASDGRYDGREAVVTRGSASGAGRSRGVAAA